MKLLEFGTKDQMFAPKVRTFEPNLSTFAPNLRTFAPEVWEFALKVQTFALKIRAFESRESFFASHENRNITDHSTRSSIKMLFLACAEIRRPFTECIDAKRIENHNHGGDHWYANHPHNRDSLHQKRA
jgi:hypothetical protein